MFPFPPDDILTCLVLSTNQRDIQFIVIKVTFKLKSELFWLLNDLRLLDYQLMINLIIGYRLIVAALMQCLLMTCRTAGEVFSVSLAQGGPAPCFLREWCYQFLAEGQYDALQLTRDDIDDCEYTSLIDRVSTFLISCNE